MNMRTLRFPLLLLVGLAYAGCDSLDDLLAVDLPGQVTDDALSGPLLAETLVRSAQGDFECSFVGHYFITGIWAQELIHTGSQVGTMEYQQRVRASENYGIGDCTTHRGPVWRPMHQTRKIADIAIERLDEMPEGSVANLDFLKAWGYAYGGYATLLLAEPFCGFVENGDRELRPREYAFEDAERRFTLAIQHAEAALNGARGDEARDILNMALVGRARTRLNLGDNPGVLEDASRVDVGYVRYATYDASPRRRNSMLGSWVGGATLVLLPTEWPDDYENLTVGQIAYPWDVDGVPDPRLPVIYRGQHTRGFPWFNAAHLVLEDDTDMPFASWREAQLMIAEVHGGQVAVDIINTLRDTYDLPHFSSGDPIAIRDQVREERRRELLMQGIKLGDYLRWGTTDKWATGTDLMGQIYGDETCMPVPIVEFL